MVGFVDIKVILMKKFSLPETDVRNVTKLKKCQKITTLFFKSLNKKSKTYKSCLKVYRTLSM